MLDAVDVHPFVLDIANEHTPAGLEVHPVEELPFSDLVRLPELFAFQFIVQVDDMRGSLQFEVQRQGLGWDMVRIANEYASAQV